MSDLRNRIQEGKDVFDEIELSKNHEKRFHQKLESNSKPASYTWWRVAAVLAIVFATSAIYWNSKLNVNEAAQLEKAAEEIEKPEAEIPLKDASNYYQHSVDQQFATIEEFYGDEDSKELIDETKELIKELQAQYELLEAQLEETKEDRIVIAMINNYKSRIELLEDLINKLNYIKQQKLNQNEIPNQSA